jgi:hypothetical protein
LPIRFHPVTATFVRSGSTVGIVPSHPLDNRGKTPVNLAQGVMPLTSRAGTTQSTLAAGSKWKVVKDPPREALVSYASAAKTPARVTRSVAASNTAVANAARGGSSTIVYDAKEHRFVNSNVPVSSTANVPATGPSKNSSAASAVRSPSSVPTAPTPGSSRAAMPSRSASARIGPPPPAQRSTAFTRGESSAGSTRSRGATMQTGSAPRTSAPAAAPAPRATGRPH